MILGRPQKARLQRIARGRSEENVHLLEGPKAIRDAIAGGHVAELWVRRDLDPELREDLLARARDAGAALGEGSRADFDSLARTVTSQGVLAVVRDTARPLLDLIERPGLLLWLDGVQDPGNVGAVVRVAAAFGAAGLLVGAGSADPLGWKALRASAGLALRVPFARASAEAIAEACAAADRPVWLLEAGGDDLLQTDEVAAAVVLVVGAEGPGVGPQARAVASHRVGIALAPGVDSLNVAVAAGIAVAHLMRAVR